DGSVADALPDAARRAVHAVGARLERGDGVDYAETAIAVAVPVDLDRGVHALDDAAHEADEIAHAPRRGVADGVADADPLRPRLDGRGVKLLHVLRLRAR